MNDRTTLYFARMHWIIFLWPVLFLAGSVWVWYYYSQLREITLFVGGFSLLWLLMTWVNYYFSSLTIKQKQVIFRTGLIVRQTIDIPLSKIESIDIRQTILGSLFHYGSLLITGTGGTRHIISYLNRPLTCRRYIEQLMHDN